MLTKFLKYQKEVLKIESKESVLLTVSGGADSMVMMDFYLKAKINFVVAHCNFKLRGEESERDMNFVIAHCKATSITYYVKCFDTQKYANDNKISIQMAARDLRYEWFEELRNQHHIKHIATAHHLDDQAETFFINLVRGTGIAGLHGILPKSKYLIRPLMFLTRAEIEEYASENSVDFISDSSNASDKYLRNYIRHNILPLFTALNTNFITNLASTIDNIASVEQEFKLRTKILFNSMLEIKGKAIVINIVKLLEIKDIKIYLFEFLSQYGFNNSSISDIYNSLITEKSGLRFFSDEYRLIKDRGTLIITPLLRGDQNESKDFYIIDKDFTNDIPIAINFEFTTEMPVFSADPSYAYFDSQNIDFPLILRRWNKGDSFYPFGLKGKKLISDFFIDNKLSIAQKEEVWLLCSGDKVMWIVGYRSDNRFKIKENTKEILILKFENGTH